MRMKEGKVRYHGSRHPSAPSVSFRACWGACRKATTSLPLSFAPGSSCGWQETEQKQQLSSRGSNSRSSRSSVISSKKNDDDDEDKDDGDSDGDSDDDDSDDDSDGDGDGDSKGDGDGDGKGDGDGNSLEALPRGTASRHCLGRGLARGLARGSASRQLSLYGSVSAGPSAQIQHRWVPVLMTLADVNMQMYIA